MSKTKAYLIPFHVIELWRKQGKTETEIKALDRKFRNDVARRNWPTPAQARLPSVDVVAGLNQEMSCAAIARRYGVSHPTVTRYLRNSGYEIVNYGRKEA